MAGILQLPIAKMIELWGRYEGFAAMTGLATLGLVLTAVCKNVEKYAAAQVRGRCKSVATLVSLKLY